KRHSRHKGQAIAGKVPLQKRLHPVAGIYCSACVFQSRVNTKRARGRDTGLSIFQRVSQRDEVCDNGLECLDVRLGSREAANLGWRIIVRITVRLDHRETERQVRGYIVNLELAVRGMSDGLYAEADLRRAPELIDQAG